MRLIDADQLIMDLSDYALQESPNDNMDDEEKDLQSQIYAAIMFCIDFVEQTKTAYDVDKVVEELEIERKTANNTYNSFNMDVDLGRVFGLEKAIGIVKHGGVYESEQKLKEMESD